MPELLGYTKPRVYTPPRPQEPDATAEHHCECGCGLTENTSHGFSAIEFARELLSLPPFPWQAWLLVHALELNPDGSYRWRIVIVEVARQNGKTLVEIILALWHLYVMKSPTVIGTAQNLENAEKAWKEAVARARSDEELAEMIPEDGVYLGHPKQFQIVHNEDGKERTSEYRVTAAGRGFSGDLILMDELREQKNWDSWAQVTNTMNARPRAQTWCFSNAPDALGVVLRYLRALAHRELGWPDGDEDLQGAILGEIEALPEFEDMPEVEFDTGFFEWSMAPGLPRNHPQGLMQANPACNHTEVTPNCITYRALISGLRTSPAHIAEAEICCRETTIGVGGPFPEGSWETTRDDEARPAPSTKICVCVEVSNRREQTYITRAGWDSEGQPVVGVREDRAGTDWVIEYLKEQRKTFAAVVVRTGAASPVAALLKEMQDARLPIVEWKGNEIPAAHGQMFDRLRDSTIKHLAHGGLDTAATSAVERIMPGGGWVVDHNKSPTDVAPLLAAIGAVWGLNHLPPAPKVHGWNMEKVKEWESR
jgi:hypothetical protein